MVRAPLLDKASSTVFGRVSEAGVRDFWNDSGTPSGRYVATRCAMYFSCVSKACVSLVEMSTLRRSDTGPSSSTFQRAVKAVTKSAYSERGPSCVYNGSDSHCANPKSSSQGKSERCHLRPACAMP
eukprot:2006816-Pleurochrysis_carterae.AAC.2